MRPKKERKKKLSLAQIVSLEVKKIFTKLQKVSKKRDDQANHLAALEREEEDMVEAANQEAARAMLASHPRQWRSLGVLRGSARLASAWA